MTLDELYFSNRERYNTDKGRPHSYIQSYYRFEFADRDRAVELLEIGVYKGGSLRLLGDWFRNGNIQGIDVADFGERCIIADAYSISTAQKFEDGYFDYIIDDGPHSLESQKQAIKLYTPKLNVGGKLIIEDLKRGRYVDELIKTLIRVGNFNYKVFNFSEQSDVPDDIIFEITNDRMQKY